jgi:hypothetical protein
LLAALGQGFRVLGTHATISGCALPPDTPEDILDDMLGHFSHQLREDVGVLMQHNIAPILALSYKERRLTRISSTESQPASLHSPAEEEYHVNALVGLWDILRAPLERLLR